MAAAPPRAPLAGLVPVGESRDGEPRARSNWRRGREISEPSPLESGDLSGLPVRQGPRLLGFVAAATDVFAAAAARQRQVSGGRRSLLCSGPPISRKGFDLTDVVHVVCPLTALGKTVLAIFDRDSANFGDFSRFRSPAISGVRYKF